MRGPSTALGQPIELPTVQFFQRILLDQSQFLNRQVERGPLTFEIDQPFPYSGDQALHLLLVVGIGIIEVKKLLDLLDRKSQPLTPQDELYPSDFAF